MTVARIAVPLQSPTTADAVMRSVLAGAAAGGRTFTGLAALAATAPADGTQPDATLARPGVRATVVLMAATELVMDKLPQAPSRLQGPGLAGRLLVAAVSGAVITRRRAAASDSVTGDPIEPLRVDGPERRLRDVLCVGAAVGAAAASARLGVRWRSWSARGAVTSFLGAVAEDAVVLGLAGAAARTG